MGEQWLLYKTEDERKKLQYEYEVLYSELICLSYFVPLDPHVIDLIHNLKLGVIKHTFKTWMFLGCLNDAKLEKIIDRMKKSHGMSKAYKKMKADK